MSHPGNIMIVDDNPENLVLLEEILRQRGHEVRAFPRGRLALAAANQAPPDLILLDINMPEMNGYEVCERLKSSAELAAIPVIFLSASNETQDKVQAFRSGAVDYISKPFQFEEVHARVETHLQLHDLQRGLKLDKERLEHTVEARTTELSEANRRLTILDRSKSDFLNMISHEFRTPLNGLLGVAEIILGNMPFTRESTELRELFELSRQRILALLDDALLLTQIDVEEERFRPVSVSLDQALNQAIKSTAQFAESRHVTIRSTSAELPLVLGHGDWLSRALHALLETAVKFSSEGETVQVSSNRASDSLRVIIESDGKCIPGSALPKFFDSFSISEVMTPGGDLGVGPALAYRILSLFSGSVKVANRKPAGIRLTISLQQALRGDCSKIEALPSETLLTPV
jgi:DNA-binding response OmpR family regulator